MSNVFELDTRQSQRSPIENFFEDQQEDYPTLTRASWKRATINSVWCHYPSRKLGYKYCNWSWGWSIVTFTIRQTLRTSKWCLSCYKVINKRKSPSKVKAAAINSMWCHYGSGGDGKQEALKTSLSTPTWASQETFIEKCILFHEVWNPLVRKFSVCHQTRNIKADSLLWLDLVWFQKSNWSQEAADIKQNGFFCFTNTLLLAENFLTRSCTYTNETHDVARYVHTPWSILFLLQ